MSLQTVAEKLAAYAKRGDQREMAGILPAQRQKLHHQVPSDVLHEMGCSEESVRRHQTLPSSDHLNEHDESALPAYRGTLPCVNLDLPNQPYRPNRKSLP